MSCHVSCSEDMVGNIPLLVMMRLIADFKFMITDKELDFI